MLSPGDAYRIAPGHDAWVEGDDAFVGYEFKGAAGYAKADSSYRSSFAALATGVGHHHRERWDDERDARHHHRCGA